MEKNLIRKAEEAVRWIINGLTVIEEEALNGDGLSDLYILTGDIELLQSEVVKKLRSKTQEEGLDVEILELDSTILSRDYVDKLRKPTGQNGGFIVINNFSDFAAIADINLQIYMLSRIMRNPFGCERTGWHIIFLENTVEKDKWWPNSCIHYYQGKSVLRCWYIE